MAKEETESAQESDWKRWTNDPGPFYRACSVYPLEAFFDTRQSNPAATKPDIEVTAGITRQVLRNLPTVLIVVLAIYVPASAFGFIAEGRLVVPIALPDAGTIGLFVPAVVIGGIWLYLIYRIVASPLSGSLMYRSLVFYATVLPLGAGTLYALYEVVANTGSAGQPAMTVQAGYFLFVLVAGHLVYDGLVLKTENLFAQLRNSDIVKQDAYEKFYREELTESLGYEYERGSYSIPRSIVFALAVALAPLLLPFLFASFQPWGILSYTAYNLVTLFVIAVFYDVFVLIYYFVELLRQDILDYQPFHPDEHGGFRDLGRFAMRVNLILLVAGMYVAYRFYAEGVVRLSGDEISSSLALLTWGLFYIGPIVAYACLTLFWLYHSFLRLHHKMKEGRQRKIEERQRQARDENPEPPRNFDDIESDAQPWESLQNAPTWPIKRQSLLGIVVVDALPLIASFVL